MPVLQSETRRIPGGSALQRAAGPDVQTQARYLHGALGNSPDVDLILSPAEATEQQKGVCATHGYFQRSVTSCLLCVFSSEVNVSSSSGWLWVRGKKGAETGKARVEVAKTAEGLSHTSVATEAT